jgi:thiosulfate oxidation carrier complex protein SoxZ
MIFGTPRVKVPERARPGETVVLRTLVGHAMESGFRKGPDGVRVPRRIVNRFVCSFEGDEILAVDLEPAMSANPYFEFAVTVTRSGTFRFVWTDDGGEEAVVEAAIVVEP